MALAASHQEPYTMYPNRYTDIHKPTLTDTQKAICDVVIRMTYGWHRRSARISIPTFIAKTGKSRRAIITAKSALVESGLLILVEEGGGKSTSRYMLDLYYDRAEEVIHPVEELSVEDTDVLTVVPKEVPPSYPSDLTTNDAIPPSEELTSTPTTAILDNIPDEEPADRDATSPSTSPISDSTTTSNDTITPLDATHEVEPSLVVECQQSGGTSDAVVLPATDHPIVEGALIPISDSHIAPEPSTTVADVPSRGADNAPLPYKDLDLSIININKKHTEADESTVATTSRENISTLRCMFHTLFPEAEEKADYGFWSYLVSIYDVERCMDKIRYMGEHRRHNPISNPQGFLRRALEQNYQPPLSILKKIKAEEAAKVASERSRKEAEERRAMIGKYNYEAATDALQKLMETLA